MPPELTVPTQLNPETEMLHIKKVSIPGAFHQAYCGYRTRDNKPEERDLDLEEDNICTTCIDIFVRRNPDALAPEQVPSDTELTRSTSNTDAASQTPRSD